MQRKSIIRFSWSKFIIFDHFKLFFPRVYSFLKKFDLFSIYFMLIDYFQVFVPYLILLTFTNFQPVYLENASGADSETGCLLP